MAAILAGVRVAPYRPVGRRGGWHAVTSPGDRDVEQLAIAEGAFPDWELSAVGNGLDDLSGLPFGRLGEPVGGCVGSGECRDVPMDAWLHDAFLCQDIPHLGADRLLGLV